MAWRKVLFALERRILQAPTIPLSPVSGKRETRGEGREGRITALGKGWEWKEI